MLGSLNSSITAFLLPFFRLQLGSNSSRRLPASVSTRPEENPISQSFRFHKSLALCVLVPHTPRALNTQLGLTVHLGQVILKNRLRYVNGGEHVGDQTNRQRNRETLNGPCTEQEEKEGRDHSCHVGVDNGEKGFVEACFDGRSCRLAVAQLFTDTLED